MLCFLFHQHFWDYAVFIVDDVHIFLPEVNLSVVKLHDEAMAVCDADSARTNCLFIAIGFLFFGM